MNSTHLRLILVTLCLATAPTHAADRVYRDQRWGFEIAQPEGWRSEPVESVAPASVRVRLRGPETSQSGEVCNIAAMDVPATSQLTQGQISQAISQGALADTTLNEMRSVDPGAKRLSKQIVAIGSMPAQETETQMTLGPPGERVDMITISLGAAIPGRTYFVNCSTVSTDYDRLKPELDRLEHTFHIIGK